MAKHSHKGQRFDSRMDNFTSDEFEHYKDAIWYDDRRDTTAAPRRIHKTAAYVKGYSNVGLIKTDYNTDYQWAQSGNPEACLRVGRAFLFGDEANHVSVNRERARSYLEWARDKGVSEAENYLAML